jgi:hypothetical protein
MNRSSKVLIGVVALVVMVGYWQRSVVRDAWDALSKAPVPSAMPYPSGTPTPIRTQPPVQSMTPAPSAAPTAINLDIPFVSQAPHKVWDTDHEEFCEEAATLMVASYIRTDRSVTDPDVAEAKLQQIKAYEMATFGYFEDTTAAETVRILREFFDIGSAQVMSNPTVEQIKSWIAAGKAVIVPSAGRELGNPNFKAPGPLYHMVVIKGFTASGQFITNDPGTRKGADYIYEQSVIMNAMHDWNGGDVSNGRKVVIVVG